MNLLWLCPAVDLDDPALAFIGGWLRSVAMRVQRISVIAMRVGRVDLPQNVEVMSLGKEYGHSEIRRGVEFYRALGAILRRAKPDVCFSHMVPLFTVMAAPALRIHQIPIATWYAHPALTPLLKIAHHLSDRVLTSIPGAYPYKRDKLVVIGQGIDTDVFSVDPNSEEAPPVILCVGRMSPVKRHRLLLRAVSRVRVKSPSFRCEIVGSPQRRGDADYVMELRRLVSELEIEDVVVFRPAVSFSELPKVYRRAAVHVNTTPTGSGDKVVLEALSCGRPSLVVNGGFKETFGRHADGLLLGDGDPEGIADAIVGWLAMGPTERARIGAELRHRVVMMHGLNSLAGRLLGGLSGLSRV
jgi:glycosyltransferase involved in cell wall biosynthesis